MFKVDFEALRHSVFQKISKILLSLYRKSLLFFNKLIARFSYAIEKIIKTVLSYFPIKKHFSSSINSRSPFRSSSAGVILILVIVLLPIILLYTKYAIDKMTEADISITGRKGGKEEVKKYAREAAYWVARNWNPGLTLTQQKDAVYKIADAVYNANPVYGNSILGQAIPGIAEKQYYQEEVQGSPYTPLKVNYVEVDSLKTSEYETKTKHFYHWKIDTGEPVAWNSLYISWLATNKASKSNNRVSVFDEINETELANNSFILNHQDVFAVALHPYTSYVAEGYPTNAYYNTATINSLHYFVPTADNIENYVIFDKLIPAYTNLSVNHQIDSDSADIIEDSFYTVRKKTSEDYVEISITNDNIKVKTDKQAAYAVPAECNVDIVLAVPVNGATSNVNNYDASSPTAGEPYYQGTDGESAFILDTIKTTPIYQMGQALKEFIRDNFYHTRGVYMSLIPYSGKISLSPDRVDWTIAVPPFNSSSINTQFMLGACLYSTSGIKDADLTQNYKVNALFSNDTLPTTDTPYYWGGVLTGCPIMSRRGAITADPRYGNNSVASGLLLDFSNPSEGDDYKFRRMNLNPCYGGYANLLNMKCERNCTHFLPNPYYIIEPTSDLVEVYEMCNCLYPIYDLKNVSNFIFLPLEWAGNMFSEWTNNPEATATDDQLSRESKIRDDRKKAIILLINKPDWFEPGELTYLGFDNDASEFPAVESDKIDFSIDYSDASKKFADGSPYNGTIQGAKKILKFTDLDNKILRDSSSGYYNCYKKGVCRFMFPHKGLIKIVVEKGTTGKKITLQQPGNSNYGSICYGGGRFVARGGYQASAVSTDGFNWVYSQGTFSAQNICYGNGIFVGTAAYPDSAIEYSLDGLKWTKANVPWKSYYSVCYGNNTFVVSSGPSMYSLDGISWKNIDMQSREAICYGNEIFLATEAYGKGILYSRDGIEWIPSANAPVDGVPAICYGGGKFVGVSSHYYTARNVAFYSTDGGLSEPWKIATLPSTAWWNKICYGNGVFVAVATKSHEIAYSNDGIEWHSSSIPACCAICYGDGKFVALSGAPSSGKEAVYYSIDGQTWSDEIPALSSSIKFTNITAKADGTTTNKYNITKRQTFFIEPSQITEIDENGNYYIEFEAEYVRLISAEITNAVIEDNRVTPVDVTYRESEVRLGTNNSSVLSWKDTTVNIDKRTINLKTAPNISEDSTISMSNGGLSISSKDMEYNSTYGWKAKDGIDTPYLKIISDTNAKVTLEVVDFDTAITFSSDSIGDSSNIFNATSGMLVQPDAAQKVTRSTTFVFSGRTNAIGNNYSSNDPNFCHNLSKYKVKYKPYKCSISAATLKNQCLRDYVGCYGLQHPEFKQLILSDGKYAIQSCSSTYCLHSTFGTISRNAGFNMQSYANESKISLDTLRNYLTKFRDECVVVDNYTAGLWSGSDGTWCRTEYRVGSDTINYIIHGATCETVRVIDSNNINIDNRENASFIAVIGGLRQFYAVNNQTKSLISTNLDAVGELDERIRLNEGIALQRLTKDLSPMITEGDYVCFQGDGTLEVTVTPNEEMSSQPFYSTVTVPSSSFRDIGGSYVAYVYIDHAYVSSLTQSSGTCRVKRLTTTQPNEDIVLVVDKNTADDTNISRINITNHNWRCMAYGHGGYVIGGDDGWIGTSYAGNESVWNYQNIGIKFSGMDFDSSDNTFYACTPEGKIYKSLTGTEWEDTGLNGGISDTNNDFSIKLRLACGNGKIVLMRKTDHKTRIYDKELGVWNSEDGNIPTSTRTYAFCFGKDKFLAVDRIGDSYSSINGIDWELVCSNQSFRGGNAFEGAITYGVGKYVTVDDNNVTSYFDENKEEKKWETWNLNSGTGTRDVCYGGGTFWHLNTSSIAAIREPELVYRIIIGAGTENAKKTEITGRTVFVIDHNKLVRDGSNSYIDMHLQKISVKKTAVTYNKTETVDDLISFHETSSSNVVNGIMRISDVSGTYNNGYYEMTSGGIKIWTSKKPSTLMIKYAGKFNNDIGEDSLYINGRFFEQNGNQYFYHYKTNSQIMLLKAQVFYDVTYKFALPNANVSRYVDFSTNGPTYNSSLLGLRVSGLSYNNRYAYWTTSGGWSELYNQNIVGDFFFLIDDIGTNAMQLRFFNRTRGPETYAGVKNELYFIPGLHRRYQIYDDTRRTEMASFDLIQRSSLEKYITIGFTLPINSVLYKGGYYNNNTGYNATEAVRNVTTDACQKLKVQYGENLRIYVVKYRKQTQYKHKITGKNTTFDYGYIDKCATSTGGKAYDISDDTNEEGITYLKATLDGIAAEIKEWAGYEAAKNL